ncbi:hypothetical protein L7F22_012958 [Adiantum nelumboides]|nr:hypothetical protein [Adiantum nelumboides]
MVSPNVPKRLSGATDSDTNDVHVLAVDDSVIDRRVIEHLLKTSAYKVTAVDSGRKALEILGVGEIHGSMSFSVSADSCSLSTDNGMPIKQRADDEVNLIITDYCMPGMTGYDLLKKVKGTNALREIPVVIMSSENEPSRISSCLAEGAEEFLLKPVRLADVVRLRGHVRHPQSILVSSQEANS